MVGLRYCWVCRGGKICNIYFYRLHQCGKCSASTGLHSIFCFCHLFQSSTSGCTHESFLLLECIPVLQFCFKSNAGYLLMPCYSPTLFFRLSDCLTSFTLLFLTLPLFLIVHASTLSAILYSAAAAGNLISASSSSSAHESSYLKSLASDA